jgi:hypothetical protein
LTQITQNTLPSPALVQRHLHRMRYPARRDDLLDHARSECARVTHALELLPDREYSRPTDVNKAFRDLVREYLAGAHYPARRDDLVQHAQSAGADQALVDGLRQIPDQQYDSPDAVITEMNDRED